MRADATRRRNPRIWDTDWLVLRRLAAALEGQVRDHVSPGTRMIDMGCGDMPYRAMMERHAIAYQGADIGAGADLLIREDGTVPVANGAAQTVLSVQVLEHVRDLDAYCAEICRIMADDGRLLLSTHGTWLYHPHPEDHRRWTRTGLVEDLGQRGLVVDELVPIVGPLATTTLIRLTGFAFVARKIPVLGGAMARLVALVMNLRALAEDAVTPENMRRDNACVYLVRAHKRAAA